MSVIQRQGCCSHVQVDQVCVCACMRVFVSNHHMTDLSLIIIKSSASVHMYSVAPPHAIKLVSLISPGTHDIVIMRSYLSADRRKGFVQCRQTWIMRIYTSYVEELRLCWRTKVYVRNHTFSLSPILFTANNITFWSESIIVSFFKWTRNCSITNWLTHWVLLLEWKNWVPPNEMNSMLQFHFFPLGGADPQHIPYLSYPFIFHPSTGCVLVLVAPIHSSPLANISPFHPNWLRYTEWVRYTGQGIHQRIHCVRSLWLRCVCVLWEWLVLWTHSSLF